MVLIYNNLTGKVEGTLNGETESERIDIIRKSLMDMIKAQEQPEDGCVAKKKKRRGPVKGSKHKKPRKANKRGPPPKWDENNENVPPGQDHPDPPMKRARRQIGDAKVAAELDYFYATGREMGESQGAESGSALAPVMTAAASSTSTGPPSRKKRKQANGSLYIGVEHRKRWMEIQQKFGFDNCASFSNFVLSYMFKVFEDFQVLHNVAVNAEIFAPQGLSDFKWVQGLPHPINAAGEDIILPAVDLDTEHYKKSFKAAYEICINRAAFVVDLATRNMSGRTQDIPVPMDEVEIDVVSVDRDVSEDCGLTAAAAAAAAATTTTTATAATTATATATATVDQEMQEEKKNGVAPTEPQSLESMERIKEEFVRDEEDAEKHRAIEEQRLEQIKKDFLDRKHQQFLAERREQERQDFEMEKKKILERKRQDLEKKKRHLLVLKEIGRKRCIEAEGRKQRLEALKPAILQGSKPMPALIPLQRPVQFNMNLEVEKADFNFQPISEPITLYLNFEEIYNTAPTTTASATSTVSAPRTSTAPTSTITSAQASTTTRSAAASLLEDLLRKLLADK